MNLLFFILLGAGVLGISQQNALAQNYGSSYPQNSSQYSQNQGAFGNQSYQQSYPAQAQDPYSQSSQQSYAQQNYGSYPQSNQYGQQQNYNQQTQQYGGQQEPTYYGYAADATQQQQFQQQQQQQQYQQAPQQYQQAPQQAQQYQQQYQQPVYGQQGQPVPGQQTGNLKQFLGDENGGQQQQQGPSRTTAMVKQGAGSLAKVAGNMATGYFLGKAAQRQATNMGVPKRMTKGMGTTGMMAGLAGNPAAAMGMGMGMGMGGYGYPMNGYGYPMNGYGYPMNGYGAPMGGYGIPGGNALGPNVMNGLNSLLNR